MDNHKIKAMITNKILRLALLLIGMTFISCDKDKDVISQDKILGTWISLDKSDTLDFVDNKNFYKSSVNMRYDHYDTHKYHLDGNNLTIDFNNINCYGFGFQVTNYTKQSG